MNKVIVKYNLLNEFTALHMPVDAEILEVDCSELNNKPRLHVLLNSSSEFVTRYFESYKTDSVIKCDMGTERVYVGMTEFNDEHWYIFEYTGV